MILCRYLAVQQKSLLLAVIMLCALSAKAAISVTPIVVDFNPNGSLREDIRVVNVGKDTNYVQVTPYKIENPGTTQEKATEIRNPRDLGLLISPQKFALAPKQFRYIRIAVIKPTLNTDQIYRIIVAPVYGDLVTRNVTDTTQVGLKVAVGYGVLVILRPKNLSPRITMVRSGNQVKVTNNGNTSVFLIGNKQCSGANNCKPLPRKRLYPGNVWVFNAPFNAPVTFDVTYLDKLTAQTSN